MSQEKIARLSMDEAAAGLKSAVCVLEDRIRFIDNPERRLERQTKKIAELRAALDREEAELAAMHELLANSDDVLDRLQARVAQAREIKLGVANRILIEKTREMYRQLRELGMNPLGQMVTEEEIVS